MFGLDQRGLDKLDSGLDGAEGVELLPAFALADGDVVGAASALHALDLVAVDYLYNFVHIVSLSGLSAYPKSSPPWGVRRGLTFI